MKETDMVLIDFKDDKLDLKDIWSTDNGKVDPDTI